MNFLDKHPADWILHFLLCFVAVATGWGTWFLVAFVAILVEYEQFNCLKRYTLSEFFLENALGDLIADSLGILLGLTWRWFF